MAEATVTLRCAGCGEFFEKASREYKRQIAKRPGHNFYCKRSCVRDMQGNLGPFLKTKLPHKAKRVDELSPFRYHGRKCRSRNTKLGRAPSDITAEYLKELWDAQSGRCAMTGWPMALDESEAARSNNGTTDYAASLDRVDNTKGYFRDNVRWVCLVANLMRYKYSDDTFKRVAQAVADRTNSGLF